MIGVRNPYKMQNNKLIFYNCLSDIVLPKYLKWRLADNIGLISFKSLNSGESENLR